MEKMDENNRPEGILDMQVGHACRNSWSCMRKGAVCVCMCTCVFACACMRACVRTRALVCVRVRSLQANVQPEIAMRADFDGMFSWIMCPPPQGGADVDDVTKREWVQLLHRQVDISFWREPASCHM